MPGRSQTAPQLQLNVNWVEDDRLIYTKEKEDETTDRPETRVDLMKVR